MARFSGRHLVLIGALAGAGLLSVRDSQRQVDLGYEIARIEKDLRDTRARSAAEAAALHALHSPTRIIERARKLDLKVEPASALALYAPSSPAERTHSSSR